MTIIFGRSGGGSELNLALLVEGNYIIFLYVRFIFQPSPPPPPPMIIAQSLTVERPFSDQNHISPHNITD